MRYRAILGGLIWLGISIACIVFWGAVAMAIEQIATVIR